MYCIYNKARNLYCRWNEQVIIFDSEEQAYEFMNIVPAFFVGEHNNVCIIPVDDTIKEDVDIIKYSDLDYFTLQNENNILLEQQKNDNMKEVLKNG